MTINSILSSAGVGTCSLAAVITAASDSMSAGQQWTVLGILGAVILSIIGKISYDIGKQAEETKNLAIQCALLTQEVRNDRAAVLGKLEGLAKGVADEMELRDNKRGNQ